MLEDKSIDATKNQLPIEDENSIEELDLNLDQVETQTAHDDFDWTVGKRNTLNYTSTEKETYLNQYESTLNNVAEFEVISAKVTGMNSGDVILDINYKSDGLLSLSEFRDLPDLKIGDYVDVYVENKEDFRGQLILSRRKAKLIKAWDVLVDSHKNGTIIKGTVVSKTKGGLIVDCNGLETFLPGSQIDVKPITDYDAYVGKTMEFKVVKINEAIKNAVVSHKALIESDLAEQREAIISGLEKGQVLEGVVKNITDFGAFMDLGGVDGLLYITDISWGRINHPDEVLALNQKVNVVVLDFDEDKRRISLGLKQLTPHPWEVLGADIAEGSVIKGKIVNIEDYGAFLEIIPGVEGLIHVSEVSWSNQPVNAREFFKLGEEHEAKIVTLDRDDRKMSLSLKQLTQDPWEVVSAKYSVGTRHEGEVKNLTPYGVFVEIEEGIGGMIHISDLSWTKRYAHPSEFTKVGEKIDITVLELDSENRKLSLGHKQLEENPWDTFETVFPVGSFHEATVIKRDDKGAMVQLPYGLEAFAPIRHLKKDDGSNAEVDDVLTFKVIEFNRDDKRILVSHSKFVDDVKREAEDNVKQEVENQKKETRKTVQNTNAKVEMSTFGDLEAFSQLKEQMEDASSAKQASAAKKIAATKEEAAPAAALEATPEVTKVEEAAPVAEVVTEEAEEAAPATEAVVEEAAEAAPVAEVIEEEAAEVVPVAEAVAEEAEEAAPETEAVVEEAVASAPAKATKASAKGDDLKLVEGIGPKIQEHLNAANIVTFADLAEASLETIQGVLDSAGSAYKMHDPSTWPDQAALARDGKMDELKVWQDNLKGGKED